jgi:hypothetical protein
MAPSLHFTIGLSPAMDIEAGAAAFSFCAGAADSAFFCTPPWPRHAPRPPFDIEPSLHVTCPASAAIPGADDRTNPRAATNVAPRNVDRFMVGIPRKLNSAIIEY